MIPITRPELPPLAEYVALLEQVWSSRMLSNFATFSKDLEALASDYLQIGTRAVVSGDIGLVCAIAALDVPPGSTCLVPSFTFNSTINAVLWNGLVPVFVDIDPDTLNMDPGAARRTAERCGPSLIVATHVFGNPAAAAELRRLAAEQGAPLLFDAAHGYGSLREGVHVGALGDVEVFSLSGTKPVTCAEGGLVAAADPEFLARFEYVRAYGFQSDYNTRFQGLNGKMSELHAALATLTLPRIEGALEVRHRQVEHYRRRLQDVPGLRFQRVRDQDRSTYKDLALLFDEPAAREAARRALSAADVQTKLYFRPCHRMDAFFPFADGPLPVTDAVYERILCVPLFADLTEAQIDAICDTVRRAVAGVSAGGSHAAAGPR